MGAAEVVARELVQGDIKEIIVSTTGGIIVSLTAGPDAIILAVYDQHAKLGLALLTLSHLAEEIAAALGNA